MYTIIVLHKNKPIGEIYTCNIDQWGSQHYKSDLGSEGLANTYFHTALEDIMTQQEEHTNKPCKMKDISFSNRK